MSADDPVEDANDSELESEPEMEHMAMFPVAKTHLTAEEAEKLSRALNVIVAGQRELDERLGRMLRTVPIQASMLSARVFPALVKYASMNPRFEAQYLDRELSVFLGRVARVGRLFCEYSASVEEQLIIFQHIIELYKVPEKALMLDLYSLVKSADMNKAPQAATALGAATRFAKLAGPAALSGATLREPPTLRELTAPALTLRVPGEPPVAAPEEGNPAKSRKRTRAVDNLETISTPAAPSTTLPGAASTPEEVEESLI